MLRLRRRNAGDHPVPASCQCRRSQPLPTPPRPRYCPHLCERVEGAGVAAEEVDFKHGVRVGQSILLQPVVQPRAGGAEVGDACWMADRNTKERKKSWLAKVKSSRVCLQVRMQRLQLQRG